MRHLELHIIQSVPVACLNRDDLNSPKTAVFGGVQRARVSSQSWKRASRELSAELSSDLFQGFRTRNLETVLFDELLEAGLHDAEAKSGARELVAVLTGTDKKKKGKGRKDKDQDDQQEEDSETNDKVAKQKTIYFGSPLEWKLLSQSFKDSRNAKEAVKSIAGKSPRDAADISLFGRMVASTGKGPNLTIEAAAMFSHALSTHKADNEIDFWAAMEERPSEDEQGAALIGTSEFNSATYYRFAALNLDMLADEDHLKPLTLEERKKVVRVFLESVIKAMPGARKNTMNGNTLPVYVLGVVRESGHPIQLVNAFESPVRPSGRGFVEESVERLKKEREALASTWGLTDLFCGAVPEMSVTALIDGMAAHVV